MYIKKGDRVSPINPQHPFYGTVGTVKQRSPLLVVWDIAVDGIAEQSGDLDVLPEKAVIGYQIVNAETDDPPPGMKTYEIYPLAYVLNWFRKLTVEDKPNWRMLPVFIDDVEDPTFPVGR